MDDISTACYLEAKTCSRCGGSGKFSYNMMDGDRCYGCHGTGKVYTKRGKAAKTYLDSLCKIRADEFKVGDLVLVSLVSSNSFERVTEIRTGLQKDLGCYVGGQEDKPGIVLVTKTVALYHSPDDLLRKGYSAEEKQAQFRAALEYQAALTKEGKPKVKKAVHA